MFDTLQGQGYAHRIAKKGLFTWYWDIKLFVKMWCTMFVTLRRQGCSRQIVMTWICSSHGDITPFVRFWCYYVHYIVTLIYSSHCNITMFVTLQHLVVFVKLKHCFLFITWQGWFLFDILQKCVYITLDIALCSPHVRFGNVCHIVMLVYFLHIATWRYVWHIARTWICSSHCEKRAIFVRLRC